MHVVNLDFNPTILNDEKIFFCLSSLYSWKIIRNILKFKPACSTLKCIDFFFVCLFFVAPSLFYLVKRRSRLHIDYKSVDFIVMGFYCGSLSSSSLSHRLLSMIIPSPIPHLLLFVNDSSSFKNFFFCLGRKLGGVS